MTFKMEDFEGPLDLLLALISKNKMNIYDIRIVELIDQYLSVVQTGRAGGLEGRSEFIEMAARLVYMKSVFLLPKTEEQNQLRQELTGMLVEYSACKEVAMKLRERASGVFYAVRQPVVLEVKAEYQTHHDPALLRQAILALRGKSAGRLPPSEARFEPLIHRPVVSVSGRIIHLLRNLMKGGLHGLQSFFTKRSSRSELVATFLAVLELVRAGRVEIDPQDNLHLSARKEHGERKEEKKTDGTAAMV